MLLLRVKPSSTGLEHLLAQLTATFHVTDHTGCYRLGITDRPQPEPRVMTYRA